MRAYDAFVKALKDSGCFFCDHCKQWVNKGHLNNIGAPICLTPSKK